MLVNKARAYEVMDKYALDGLLAATQVNVYYLTDFWGALMRMGRSFFNYGVLPRNERAPAALVTSGVELNRLVEMPTWVPNVVAYTVPASLTSRDYDTGTEQPEAGVPFAWPVRPGSELGEKELKWQKTMEPCRVVRRPFFRHARRTAVPAASF